MTERMVTPLPFFKALKEVAIFYVHVFKYIIGLVALAALIQAIVPAIPQQNPTVGLAVSILASLVSMFFYAWILYRADSILMNRSETTKDALHIAKKRFIPLLGVLALYIILTSFLFLFAFALHLLGNLLNIEYVFLTIAFAVILYILVLIAFTMPAVILDQMPILRSFEYSIKIVWGHWWRTCGILSVYIIPVILISLGVLFIPRHLTLVTIYEFFVHLVTYPLMISVILILYHDLKMRHQMEGFKHISEDKSDKS